MPHGISLYISLDKLEGNGRFTNTEERRTDMNDQQFWIHEDTNYKMPHITSHGFDPTKHLRSYTFPKENVDPWYGVTFLLL